MDKSCECNPKKADNEICEVCGKAVKDCICENSEVELYKED